MKFVAYTATLNPKALSDSKKGVIMQNFVSGVAAVGDETIIHKDNTILNHDVGMMVGWVHEESKNSTHLQFRKNIIDVSAKNNKKILVADSNLFLFANPKNPEYFLRYSFNGVFPNTGIYCDDNIDPQRWLKISRSLNISLKDYRTKGHHILLCLQRNGGWSMGGVDVIDWAAATIKELRKYTDREIIIRAHPGDKGSVNYLNHKNLIRKIGLLKGVRLSKPSATLFDDLHKCHAVVNYNSSPTVGAAIEGYPVFITDPEKSQCRDIANLDLSKIENPDLPDRQTWIERISMFHWSFAETRNGECWSHMRKYV